MRPYRFHATTAVVLMALVVNAAAWEAEDYEEPSAPSCLLWANPADSLYGISGGMGAWLRNTPVFGDPFFTIFYNGIEESWYSGVGMTLRIMPHWRVAPFVGAGGAYMHSLSGESDTPIEAETDPLPHRGASYWSTHVEAGIRILPVPYIGLLEIMARYTIHERQGDRDYWFIGMGMGLSRE